MDIRGTERAGSPGERHPPPPLFFVSVHSTGFKSNEIVSADSK